MAWKQVIANSNLVQHETDRSVLIKLPGSKMKFWHPRKLVRTSGKNGYRLSISYTDDFAFKAFRNGEGQHNRRDILEERTLTAAEFEAYFQTDKAEAADAEADEG